MFLKQNRKATVVLFFLFAFFCSKSQIVSPELRPFIKEIIVPDIGSAKPHLSYSSSKRGIVKVSVFWQLSNDIAFDELKIKIIPSFKADFNWAPHLTPTDNNIIAQHVFRAPAIIFTSQQKSLSLVPDLDLLEKGSQVPWYLDMNAIENNMAIGMAASKVTDHVLFEKRSGAVFKKGIVEIGFYLFTSTAKDKIANPWRPLLSFMWEKWGNSLYEAGEPLHQKKLKPYVVQTYNWAFNTWKNAVWQEFELNGKKVGAPVFIVNVTQSPNYKEPVNEREFRSIWNQAWFNSLRSAQGLYRFAKRAKNDSLLTKALMTKELALSFPQTNGFFKSVIATEMQEVMIDGKKYNRSKGWNTKYFANSNRNPYTGDPAKSPYHIADMSFTAYWMLVWYQELEKDKRLLTYVKNYADALIKLQDKNGFFPAWLSLENLKPMDHLNQSPETSVSITTLLKLFELTAEKKYLNAAIKATEAVLKNIVPVGQWEDFETYWSCSRWGSVDQVGKKVSRNNMFKQNTFSIFWTAEALLAAYEITKQKKYLTAGQRVLDELLMAQAMWQPPYVAIRTFGGFGVMNADAEWNDARQSLFAELIIRFGKILKNDEYIKRGIVALKASFTMMYTPLNPATMQQWQAKWPFFGKEDYGFMMENYGHNGETNSDGLGIGEFTIYDWGNGAAAEAYNRIMDRHKDIIDFKSK